MKSTLILFLILILWFHLAFSQNVNQTNGNAILHNWVAAQVGELVGFTAAAFSIRMLEVSSAIHFNSDTQRLNSYIISGTVLGNLCGNYFLKKRTNQSLKAFSANVLFSSLPVIFYSSFVKLKFKSEDVSWSEFNDEFKFLLVSMFLTPIFSTIGHEIFKDMPLLAEINSITKVHPRLMVQKEVFYLSLHFKLK